MNKIKVWCKAHESEVRVFTYGAWVIGLSVVVGLSMQNHAYNEGFRMGFATCKAAAESMMEACKECKED